MRRLADFFHWFVGDWIVTDLLTGEEGAMSIRVGAGECCHVMEIRIGGIGRTELWGLDPATGNWTANGIGQDGERFTQVMLEVPESDSPQPGNRWPDRHEGMLPSGERTTAQLEFVVESADAFTVEFSEVSIGGEPRAGGRQRIVRR
jgi:hypothetical protein